MSRWRQILQSATEFAVIVTDRDGIVTEWNTGAERILGWPAGQIIGSDASRIFTPEDQATDRIAKEMRDALLEGRGIDERWHMKADGSRFWASGEMMPLREDNGCHVGFVKILRDRTNQHREGERLRILEKQLRQAQEAGGVGLFSVDVASGILIGTPEFSRLYGLEHKEERPAAEVEALIVPEDQGLVSTDDTRRAGETVPDVIYRVRGPISDSVRWIARRGELLYGADGRPDRFVGTARDVTDQKEADARRDALVEIGDRLLELSDPEEIAAVVAAIVGRTLGVGRVGYGSITEDGKTFTVPSDWTREGFPSLAGVYEIDDYGAYAEDLRQGRAVVIPDIRRDPRTADDTGPLERVGVRTLINHPVVEDGRTVAVLYVNDDHPRNWSADEVAFLADAATRTRVALERRRAETSLRESDERQRLALTVGEVGTFDLDLSTGFVLLDERARAAFGVSDGRPVTQDQKRDAVHTADRSAFDAVFRTATDTGTFDLEFRTVGIDDGATRWVHLQGHVIDGRRFVGAVRDVTDRVAADQRRSVLNAELAHRLKNNLALVSSIVTQTLRTAPDVASARKTLNDRIQALSKAHDVLMTGQRDAASLREVVRAAASLHDEEGRVRLSGPDVGLGAKASLTLSLIVHELSTNAAKYGALSVPEGCVDVVWSIEKQGATGRLRLFWEWREIGGPPVTPPERRSFGTRLIEMGLSGASEGTSEILYDPGGVRCRITASLTELQADERAAD